MKFSCPLCAGKIDGEEEWVGMQADCPYCEKEITVPAPEVLKFPPVPPPRGGESVRAMPSVPPVGRQYGAVPNPHDIGAMAAKGGDLARKGFTSVNKGLDDIVGKLPIPSHFRPKWIVVGVISLLLLIAINAARPKKRHDNTQEYLSRMLRELSSQPGAPSLQESRERMGRSYDSQLGMVCRYCNGTGMTSNSGVNCNSCWGRGTMTTPSGYETACGACGGTGKVKQSCFSCGGTGRSR